MRSEREMLSLILHTAMQDERIRAVILNGSRADPEAARDPFQDFDIVYLVTDVAPFRQDREWLRPFGEIMVMQTPELMDDPPPENQGGFVYLMQFMDGNRIDLSLYPVNDAASQITDSLTVVLLDKDGRFPVVPPPSRRDYWTKPPTAKQFADCCNEFWWCAPYVAKGLWRGQVTYARGILEHYVREQLMKMLAWYAGAQTGFTANPGYFGKFLQGCLEPVLWDELMRTYAGPSEADSWEALSVMCALFRRVALVVAGHCGGEYPQQDDLRVSAHLRHVQQLPKDSTEIY
jgi:aminoglycoside 6-adenylyltransferase